METAGAALLDAPPLAIDSGGGIALDRLSAASRAIVLARFERSLYLKTDRGGIVCIGGVGIGAGPLNLLADDLPSPAFDRVRPGMPALRTGTCWRLGAALVLDPARARVWRPLPPGPTPDPAALAVRVAAWTAAARVRAPGEGLGRIVLAGDAGGESHALYTASRPALEALAAWLESPADARVPAEPPEAAARLLGLGPGLTPSGDDLLAGVLIALAALGARETSARLWRWIAIRLAGATSEISAAHLEAASQGQGHSAVHRALDALLDGTPRDPAPCLDALDRVGHCSGWDALAGIVLALRAGARTGIQQP